MDIGIVRNSAWKIYQHSLMKARSCSINAGLRMYFSAEIAACRCRAMIFSRVMMRARAVSREACMTLSSSGGGDQSSSSLEESSDLQAVIRVQSADSQNSISHSKYEDSSSSMRLPVCLPKRMVMG